MLLGKCTEVEEFSKCRRLLAVENSFHQQYETSLAKIQTQISKLHRELSASEQEKDKKLLTYAVTSTTLGDLFLKLNTSKHVYRKFWKQATSTLGYVVFKMLRIYISNMYMISVYFC